MRPPLADPCAWVSVKPSSIFSAFTPGFAPGFSQRLVACSPTPSPHSLLRTCFDFYLPGSSQTGVPPGDRRHAHGRFPARPRAASGLSEGNSSTGRAGSPGKGRPSHAPPTASRGEQESERPGPLPPGSPRPRAGRPGRPAGAAPGWVSRVPRQRGEGRGRVWGQRPWWDRRQTAQRSPQDGRGNRPTGLRASPLTSCAALG